MECLVGDDGRLERRRDLLGQEVGKVDRREERVLLQIVHPVGTWKIGEETNKLSHIPSMYVRTSACVDIPSSNALRLVSYSS